MRTLTIHQSLHRHSHAMGAERELVLTCGLIALLVGIGGLSLLSVVTGFAFWVTAVFVLRRMAKADPIMSKVWLKHIKQQLFYPARSGVWRS
ncbi:MAG: conjugal transfer protein TrbD [Pseudodesulfovibrio sp.]|uniref:conjugal transfer protein TrbD n=1 Tax=Pseudodesulfovibrio sp. TaxID=2035812 RepID=UPI003D137593